MLQAMDFYELGKRAYRAGIILPAEDVVFMRWLISQHIPVGGVIKPIDQWRQGWKDMQEKDRADFDTPELAESITEPE